jgi:hypothetical protein
MAAMAADQRAAETATTSPNTDQRPAVGQTPETAAAAHEKQSNDQAGAARFATVPPGGERDEPAVRAGGTGRAGSSPRRPPLRPADTNSPGVRAGGSPRDESPRCPHGKRPRAEPPLDVDEPDILGGGDPGAARPKKRAKAKGGLGGSKHSEADLIVGFLKATVTVGGSDTSDSYHFVRGPSSKHESEAAWMHVDVPQLHKMFNHFFNRSVTQVSFWGHAMYNLRSLGPVEGVACRVRSGL